MTALLFAVALVVLAVAALIVDTIRYTPQGTLGHTTNGTGDRLYRRGDLS